MSRMQEAAPIEARFQMSGRMDARQVLRALSVLRCLPRNLVPPGRSGRRNTKVVRSSQCKNGSADLLANCFTGSEILVVLSTTRRLRALRRELGIDRRGIERLKLLEHDKRGSSDGRRERRLTAPFLRGIGGDRRPILCKRDISIYAAGASSPSAK